MKKILTDHRGHILANSNVEIARHLVDVHVSVYPAGTEGSGAVVTVRGKKRSNMNVKGNILFIFVVISSTIRQLRAETLGSCTSESEQEALL